MNKLQNIAWGLVILLVSLLAYQHFTTPEYPNQKLKELEDSILQLTQQVQRKEAKIDSLVIQRDSMYVKLSTKMDSDKVVIHEKHEEARANLLLLSDDESVKLFAKNLAGK